MIAENSIQTIKNLSVVQVIEHYIKLDRNGKACCPFHNEKTPSLKVTEAKGIFKCFGCGEAGDHISFVMKHDKLTFIEAIEHIAKICGVTLEYEEVADKEKYKQQKELKDQYAEVLNYAVTEYKNNVWQLPAEHPVTQYLTSRGFNKEVIADWQLGWATEVWQTLSTPIINKGWYTPANKLGIVMRSKSDTNYDGYRSRIIIPITNKHGQYIGLAGRYIAADPLDAGKDFPKYINPPQNELYDKSQVLFGLSKATKTINETSFAYLVEGYFDVISLHTNGHCNTVGICGTALTIQQAQLLKRYCNHVVLIPDHDEENDKGKKPGIEAAIKHLPILLKAGFKVDIIILPLGQDPDSYVQEDAALANVKKEDAVFWFIETLIAAAEGDMFKLGKVKEDTMQLVSLINNAIIRSQYFDAIIKKYKWPKAELQKQLNIIVDEREEVVDAGETNLDRLPKWMDKEEFLNNGYCIVNNKQRTGYYTFNNTGQVEITNFIITPIFHVYAGKDSRHLIEIDNGRRKAVLDIESKALVSIDLLQQYVVCEGPFIIYGAKPQMLRIATTLLSNFPKCIEVKFLGWQQAGFFAFVDRIYVPSVGLVSLDQWGVYKHSDQNYLIPAASAAYKELQQSGDDPYENDRVLQFTDTNTPFADWAALMNRVYADKGPVAIAYIILSIFRDIVFDIDNNCPHLYGFGERSSGKSKWAESICAVFYTKRAAFNLNSGTDFAFFSYMQRFINCPSNLNEFDEKVIKPEWFQSIKGAFDGESRQRGSIGSKNRVEIMKIRSTLILIGQYLCTMDDNSIVSRSIIEGFNEKEHTDADKQEYDKLKRLEEKGLSSILTDILKLRPIIKEQYRNTFNSFLQKWRTNTALGEVGNIRIMQNWCHLYTGWHLISSHLKLPIVNTKFEKYCLEKAMQWSKFIRSSDTLSEFWNTFAFLVDMGTAQDGWDYKIETLHEVRIRKDKAEFIKRFDTPTKVIFIRMNNVHKHYQQAYRSRTGKEGMSLETMGHYFEGRKYFLGNNKQSRFKRFIIKTENVTKPGYHGAPSSTQPETTKIEESVITSSHLFLYDELDINIEREDLSMPQNELHFSDLITENSENLNPSKNEELPFF